MSEPVSLAGIRCFEVGLLAPGPQGIPENVRRPRVQSVIVAAVSVHTCGVAILKARPDHNRVAGYSDRSAEVVARPGVMGFEVRLLGPICSVAGKNVGRAGARSIV